MRKLMRAMALLLLIPMATMFQGCNAVKGMIVDQVSATVDKKLNEKVNDGMLLTPDEKQELKAKAGQAGFLDPETGDIRWTKMLASGNGLSILLAFMLFLLRKRLSKKVGELWEAKENKATPAPAPAPKP